MGTIDLNDVGVFATVAETASFSTAAIRLDLPKSSVSRAVARLEEAAGVSLLHRTTRQVALSAAGRTLYEKVRGEIAALRHALGDLSEREESLTGSVRVTSVVDMADFFAEVVTRLVARHPAIQVDLRLTNDNVDLVAQGIDLALRFSTVRFKDSSLHVRRLCTNDVELFASPAYLARKGVPRAPADLERHDWVVYRRKTELRLEKGRRSTLVRTRGRIVCDDFTFLRAALVSGCGVGYLGAYQADADIEAGRLVRVLPDWSSPSSSLWAVWPGPRRPSHKVAAFMEAVLETVRRYPLVGRGAARAPSAARTGASRTT
jgi:DNA-binding transcriptional LysR family regulator